MKHQAVILSVKPEYSKLIFSGIKKYELRKQFAEVHDYIAFVYESRTTKGIVGYFTIGELIKDEPRKIWDKYNDALGIMEKDFLKMFGIKQSIFIIEIKNPTLFKNRVSLENLRTKFGLWFPPQNFRYVISDDETNYLLKQEVR